MLSPSIIYLSSCGSTNDEILRYATSGMITGLYTFHQKNGRGQYGNQWLSPQNLNIALSIAIPAEAVKHSPALFNYYTATVMRCFIAKLTNAEVLVKWPNDLIIGGKKIAGMLLERHRTETGNFFVIGIGLNVLQQDFEEIRKAGSLLTQTGQIFELKPVAEALFTFFSAEVQKPAGKEDICTAYNANLFRKDKVSVFEQNGIRQNGIIKHADEEGFLWIELENEGLKKFFHKEISLLY